MYLSDNNIILNKVVSETYFIQGCIDDVGNAPKLLWLCE